MIDSFNYEIYHGSKGQIGTGAGYFSNSPYTKCNLQLNFYSSVFQVKIVGIIERASALTSSSINILVYSQAEIKVIIVLGYTIRTAKR